MSEGDKYIGKPISELSSDKPPVVEMLQRRTVPELLRAGAATYEERNPLYGDNYKRIGPIMAVLFPDGIPCRTPEDHNRFGAWYMAFNKLIRYAMQFERGGHLDSAHDAMVYSAMLEELTR